jgi:exopolysaccharide production protein ExoY
VCVTSKNGTFAWNFSALGCTLKNVFAYCTWPAVAVGRQVTEVSFTSQFAKERGSNEPQPAISASLDVALEQQTEVSENAASQDANTERLIKLQLGYAAQVDLSVERGLKRVLDIFGAFILAALFSPLIATVFIVAALTGQPPIFRHKRVGRDGLIFECLKFRTMVPDAEAVLAKILAEDGKLRAEWARDHKLADDPRVTKLGKFLRSTSLDELPQLWNVVKGEMSLVGPRPVTREELLRYGRNSVVYMLVRPGVTGLWQVSGRNNVEYRKRVAMDVCYVRNQGLVLDTWILLKTILVVVTRHGAY